MMGLFQRKDATAHRRRRLQIAPRQLLGTSSRSKGRRCAGFTFKELIVVLVLLLVFGGLLLPLFNRAKRKAQRISCISNFKQIGTAFRLWAGDFGGTNELYSTQVSTNSGGAMEPLIRGEVWPVFQLMSNELNVTRVLICPADTRVAAPGFDRLRNTNLSYFLNRDAGQEVPETLLTGDRNLESAGRPVPAGQLTLTTNLPIGWTTKQHNLAGNVGFADGSVRQLSNEDLRDFLRRQQSPTNRIVIP
jgi:prepilin-type processing-associated H-X9-DG protein